MYLGGLETFDSYYLDPENDDPNFTGISKINDTSNLIWLSGNRKCLKNFNFLGCMRNLRLNGKAYPLTEESGWRGLSIDDCDGTACGGEVFFY